MPEKRNIKNLEDMISVEWSERQGCFHFDSLVKAVGQHIDSYIDGVPLDWQMVGIVGSYEEASELVRLIEDERRKSKRAYLARKRRADKRDWPDIIH